VTAPAQAPLGYVTHENMTEGSGATYRQIDYWSRKGHLVALNEGYGSGSRRYWRESEVTVARRMKALTDLGLKIGVAEQVARSGALNVSEHVRIEVA